jgi:MFS family permease
MVGIGLLTGSLILALSKTLLVAVLGYCLAAFSAGVLVAMSPLPVQLVSPNKLRGMMIAVTACFYSVGSAGGGPWAIAAITDYVFRDSLRIGDSLAIVAVVAVVCGLALLLEGRRRLNREPEAASPPTPSRSP